LILLGSDGGRSRARTYDPLIKSQLLYQLSYTPIRSGAMRPAKARLIQIWWGLVEGGFRGVAIFSRGREPPGGYRGARVLIWDVATTA
jgi:hypothetical protein